MSEGGYKIRNQGAIHFITFAVVEWVDVFTRKDYRDIVLDSIRHCQEQKGLLLHCWCIMSNHLHLIVSARNENLSDILRDFKKFTSKQLIAAIENNKKESRKECLPAGRQGCWIYSGSKGNGIAGIRIINSGDRTISHRNFTVQLLYFKKQIISIRILL